MHVNKRKNKWVHHKSENTVTPPSQQQKQLTKIIKTDIIKTDTHVFLCWSIRTNSQEKPSICAGENGLALSTLDSLQSFFMLSVIVLKNLTVSLQVSSRSESRHSKRWNLKFRTTKHQCPDSSLGFMVGTNDGGSNGGKRSRKKNRRRKMNLPKS